MTSPRTFYYFNDPNYPIQVTQSTCEITPNTFMSNNQLWENASIRQFFLAVKHYAEKNNPCTVVDIGAQSGLYSLYAKFLPNTTFYAFEPFPDTYRLLQDNLALNGITNVKTFPLGISNENGMATLNTCLHNNGLNTMGTNVEQMRFRDIRPINVQVVTLDSKFFEKNIRVDFIKIDTEGWEYAILQGGMKTIEAYHPFIQLEWNHANMLQSRVTENMLCELLENIDYIEISSVDEEKLFGWKHHPFMHQKSQEFYD